MKFSFHHEIYDNPEADDVGTIRFTARIFGREPDPLTYSTSCFAQEYLDDDQDECKSKEELNLFLMHQGINLIVMSDALSSLIDYVANCSESSEYSPGCALDVRLDFVPEDDLPEVRESVREVEPRVSEYYYVTSIVQPVHADMSDYIRVDVTDDLSDYIWVDETEEAVQVSFVETRNIQFRPASKEVVKSLKRKIYNEEAEKENKKMETYKEECRICLEEFKTGGRLVSLPCGHEFDEECSVTWFETSHLCPLCRYKLPCEDH